MWSGFRVGVMIQVVAVHVGLLLLLLLGAIMLGRLNRCHQGF